MEELLLAAAIGGLDDDADDVMDDAVILHILGDGNLENALPDIYFNLNSFTEEESRKLFRFGKATIPRLAAALGVPNRIVTDCRDAVEGRCFCWKYFASISK